MSSFAAFAGEVICLYGPFATFRMSSPHPKNFPGFKIPFGSSAALSL